MTPFLLFGDQSPGSFFCRTVNGCLVGTWLLQTTWKGSTSQRAAVPCDNFHVAPGRPKSLGLAASSVLIYELTRALVHSVRKRHSEDKEAHSTGSEASGPRACKLVVTAGHPHPWKPVLMAAQVPSSSSRASKAQAAVRMHTPACGGSGCGHRSAAPATLDRTPD